MNNEIVQLQNPLAMNGKWLKKIEKGSLEFVDVSKIDRLWLLINIPV